jgi:hypothetical protein
MTRIELISELTSEHERLKRAAHAIGVAIAELQMLAPVGNGAAMSTNQIEDGLFAGQSDAHKDGA